MHIHLTMGVELGDTACRETTGLWRQSIPAGAMDHLALQIRHLNNIGIDDADPANARRRQIQQQG